MKKFVFGAIFLLIALVTAIFFNDIEPCYIIIAFCVVVGLGLAIIGRVELISPSNSKKINSLK